LEVRPKAKGIDTRNELIKFHEENYSANLMHLVVYTNGNKYFVAKIHAQHIIIIIIIIKCLQYNYCVWIFSESLDKIQILVEEKFQDIRNTNRGSFHTSSQPCKSEHLQVLVFYLLLNNKF
jgi:insulysin